jgi:hypothetical protein
VHRVKLALALKAAVVAAIARGKIARMQVEDGSRGAKCRSQMCERKTEGVLRRFEGGKYENIADPCGACL